MFRLYLLFAPLSVLPICFLLASAVRFVRHYGDGKGGGKAPFKKYAMTKKLLTLLLSLVTLLCIFDLDPTQWPASELIVRAVYFALMALSYFVSFLLIGFDSTRQLEISWLGQRGFWPLSCAEGLICLALQINVILTGGNQENVKFYMISRSALDAIMVVLTGILSYLALAHPNDFYLAGAQPLMRDSLRASPKRGTRMMKRQISIEDAKSDTAHELSAVVTDFKVKAEQGLIIFRILIKLAQNEHSIQRSFSEFRALHESLQARFSREHFPNLEFPALPQLSRSGPTIDEKIQQLNEYLAGLCVSELMNDDLLDFFGIEGKDRMELEQRHDSAMHALGFIDSSPSNKGSFRIMEPEPTALSLAPQLSYAIYISLSIVSWEKSSEPDGHINYTMEWKCVAFPSAGRVVKRFNEFYALHQALKNELAPCELPGFPKKNYLPNFSKAIDETAINLRKASLEEYLMTVCNDPAYLSDQTLHFLSCAVQRTDFWASRKLLFEYSLHTPIEWEGELDDDETHYTVYLLTLLRRDQKEPTSTLQWRVGRRFREFDKLHREISNRQRSPAFNLYCAHIALSTASSLPQLPKKSLVPVSTHQEIEQRRRALQAYMQDLLKMPGLLDSHAFRVFIQEPAAPTPAES